jgi:hypothetical protein
MGKDQAAERPSLKLPALGHSMKTNVVRDDGWAQSAGVFEQKFVAELIGALFLCRSTSTCRRRSCATMA